MNVDQKELFLFELGKLSLALRIEDVENVFSATEITPIPKTANFVLGIAAVRGKIMTVIDGGLRLGISQENKDYFAVCQVRGNETAIVIDKPLEAKNLAVRELDNRELDFLLGRHKLNAKLFHSGWEILEKRDDRWSTTGRKLLEINADQFVSDQMASQILAS